MKKHYNLSSYFIFIFTFLISLSMGAQELSNEFLEGLPESIRDNIEVQNEIAEDQELEVLFRSDTSAEKNKMILRKLEDQLDALKKLVEPDDPNNTKAIKKLERFGDSFFSSIQSSFMPINVPNLGADYIVDVGDSFELMLTGKTNKKGMTLEVQRDGSLMIPEIGKINIAGKKLKEANDMVTAFIDEASIGLNAYLTLSNIRDVQVLLLGGVESPGIYTLSGGSNILGALNVVGGIKPEGSYRNIELRRDNEVLEVIDLYDIFVKGEYDIKNTLRSGDTIFVNPTALNIPISGGVNIEAIFEILPSETIDDAIRYAGGFSQSFAGFNYVTLQKTTLNESRIIDIGISDLDKVNLTPRDSILVPYFTSTNDPIKYVTIEGSVNRPGQYYINDNETLDSVLTRAGGYKSNAYLFGAALFRHSAIELQKQFAQMNYADTVNYIISGMGKPGGGSGGSLDLLVEELRAQSYSGRVVIDITSQKNRDILLNHGDRIVIPKLPDVVHMFGDFKNPANITYNSELGVEDYLDFAGGLKKSAYNELVIIDPDGTSHVYRSGLLPFKKNIDLYPGSIIYAPRDIGKLSGITYAAAVSPILSSLALSLASLNSISNN